MTMDLSLKGKKAMVCGSTQGIGKATAIELAALGAQIVLFSRSQEKLQEVMSQLAEVETPHEIITADFSHPAEVKEAITSYVDEQGGAHILINNTGGPPAGRGIDADPEEYRVAFNLHLISNQVNAQALVPFMIRENYGRIINIISTSVKEPISGIGVSNTIRGSVASWSKTLAGELGEYGITVNNILPGSTSTNRLEAIFQARASKLGYEIEDVREAARKEIPLKRFASSDEVANAIAFLASPAASYISGINLPVDGGRTGCL